MAALDEAFRSLIRDVVREELHESRSEMAVRPPSESAAEQPLLTINEAAALARVDAATVRAWIKRGALGTYRAGRVYRVRREELDAYLARQGQAPPTTNIRQRARDFVLRRAAGK